MADLRGAAEQYSEIAAAVARAWAGLRDMWLDADAERFVTDHLTEAFESLRRLAAELAGVSALCERARRELT